MHGQKQTTTQTNRDTDIRQTIKQMCRYDGVHILKHAMLDRSPSPVPAAMFSGTLMFRGVYSRL